MKILLLHNKYKYAGGEDKVFESEGELLSNHNHQVERLVFDNSLIETGLDKILSGIMGVYNLRSANVVDKKIKEFKPDILHVHNFVPLASPSIFYVAKRHKVPVVLTLHNYRLICPSATLYHDHKIYEKSMRSIFPVDAIIKGVYRNSVFQTAGVALMTSIHNLIGTWRNKVDKFITLTAFARSKFLESRVNASADQFMLKPNFIDDPGSGRETREDFFLFVGRLSEEKGIRVLLNAFKSSDLKLVIIGDGPMKAEVESVVKERSNIQHLGFQPKAVIMDNLKRAKSLIFPSTWYEGFPITILEALATGTPVIGSRIGGIAEIVKDKFNGLLFEPGDEGSLVRSLNELKHHDLKALSANARKSYLECYTPERNYKILMDIYNAAMNRQ
jgi:glycosyltransferase involved in cell wall biosynthesis